MVYTSLMSFELISEITRWTARLSFILFAIAFVYDGFRTGHKLVRRLWQAYVANMLLYFATLITYHLIIRHWPSFDILNGLLSLGVILFLTGFIIRFKKQAQAGHLCVPIPTSYYLAFLYTVLPISRILPAETNHLIYHLMLYSMGAIFIFRISLDIKARFKRPPATS